jgi:predicted SAM-dependent methyltransferase
MQHLKEDDHRKEFLVVEQFCKGLGLDVGTGTNRFSPTVLGIDNYNHVDADMVWDCLDKPYPFKDSRFDFVFSSHVIEDFEPSKIQGVFDEWLRNVKVGGYLILLVPDMENGRYPDWDEIFTAEDEEVKKGERRINELKGNPSHRCTMGLTLLQKISINSKYKNTVVQSDTIPHDSMTIDFVVKKL